MILHLLDICCVLVAAPLLAALCLSVTSSCSSSCLCTDAVAGSAPVSLHMRIKRAMQPTNAHVCVSTAVEGRCTAAEETACVSRAGWLPHYVSCVPPWGSPPGGASQVRADLLLTGWLQCCHTSVWRCFRPCTLLSAPHKAMYKMG